MCAEFSSLRSVTPQLDLNSILDEGATTSIGGTHYVGLIYDISEITLNVTPPREDYNHG